MLLDARSMRDAGAPVYLYSFDYERTPGVGFVHAEDLNYVMGYGIGNFDLPPKSSDAAIQKVRGLKVRI